MKKVFLLLPLILTPFFKVLSQDYTSLKFSALTSRDGLPSVECNFVFQDSDDFLWIGTNEGLYRYDGYNFKNFDLMTDSSLKNLKFYNCAEDRAGNLAFATSGGVILYAMSGNKFSKIKPDERLQVAVTNSIFSVAYDTKNRLWFGNHDDGLFLYDAVVDSVLYFPSDVGVKDILCSKKGDIWVSKWGNGLARFNESDSTLEHFRLFDYSAKEKSHNLIYSLFEGADNTLWVGTWDGGLYALDISTPEHPVVKKWFEWKENNRNSISGDIIYNMALDSYGNLWLGTPYGLSILKDPLSANVKIFNYQAGKNPGALLSNEISSVIKDRTGVMWMATNGGGVNKVNLNQIKFKPYSITEIDPQKKSQTVHGFTYDLENRLLIGVQSLGFGSYQLDKELFKHFSDIPEYAPLKDIKINTIKNFTWDNDSSLWLGTRYRGLIKYNVRTGKYRMLKDAANEHRLPAVEVFFVRKDLNNTLWVSTNNGLFRVIPGKSGRFDDYRVEEVNLPGTNQISDITFDKAGKIWIATYEGDLLRSGESLKDNPADPDFIYVKKAVPGTKISISALFFDSAGKLWLGSGNGLKILDKPSGEFTCPWPIEKMDGVKIYDITEDKKGNILATSNKGLIQLKKGREKNKINMYGARNGLQSNVFIKGALFHDQYSNLFIGGHNGFNHFDPLLIKEDTIVPKIVFTDLKTSEEVHNPNIFNEENPFTIHYDDNLFTVSFSSLDFRNPANTRYAYKLEGLDNEWQTVSANSRTATYVNLKPGRYTFKVMGTSVMGKWNEQAATLPIFVTTAPYLTWWAYLLYVLGSLGIVMVFFLMYRNQMKAKQALKLEHVERTKSEKLNQFKLQFFTNLSHELLTPLSILLIISEKWDEYGQFKEKKIARMLERNVNKLHQHIKQMLQFRKAEMGSTTLDLKEQALTPLIQEVVDNYKLVSVEKDMNFVATVQNKISGCFDAGKLDICLNNLLSNAFKYTQKGGSIDLQVKQIEQDNRQWVRIIVSDNGEGIPEEGLENIFNRFYRLSTDYTRFQDGLGIGLALTKNLVDLQGGTIRVESVLGEGTTFVMELPISWPCFNANAAKNDPIIAEDKIADEIQEILNPNYSSLSSDMKDRKTILIIEDNEDFLILVMMYLKKYYNVITCTNGKEALELANDHEIDLMVSDLMLPEMDGYELCKTIKSTVNTSHIPFIIVTARANDHQRLLGYKSGVDSYLTKPVNMAVLISRIDSLLKKRESISTDFNRGAFLEPEKVVTTSIDEDILTKAKEIVEENMANTEFTVRVLCDELAMSNSMLYRKIKGILNLTPNDFIKNIRLRRAAQLLQDKNVNISEVAYQTGFNDLSYFGVCFKKQYGATPTSYQKQVEAKYEDLQIEELKN